MRHIVPFAAACNHDSRQDRPVRHADVVTVTKTEGGVCGRGETLRAVRSWADRVPGNGLQRSVLTGNTRLTIL